MYVVEIAHPNDVLHDCWSIVETLNDPQEFSECITAPSFELSQGLIARCRHQQDYRHKETLLFSGEHWIDVGPKTDYVRFFWTRALDIREYSRNRSYVEAFCQCQRADWLVEGMDGIIDIKKLVQITLACFEYANSDNAAHQHCLKMSQRYTREGCSIHELIEARQSNQVVGIPDSFTRAAYLATRIASKPRIEDIQEMLACVVWGIAARDSTERSEKFMDITQLNLTEIVHRHVSFSEVASGIIEYDSRRNRTPK